MIEPIFEGVRSHCLRHPDVLLLPAESECKKCQAFRSMKPPFDVRCIRGGFGVTKGSLYTVIWIVRDGVSDNKDLFGYVFKSNKEKEALTLHPRVFDPADFEFGKEEEEETSNDVDWAMIT